MLALYGSIATLVSTVIALMEDISRVGLAETLAWMPFTSISKSNPSPLPFITLLGSEIKTLANIHGIKQSSFLFFS